MSVTMTSAAARRVQNFLVKRGGGVGLRLAVRTSGCSGLSYALEYADNASDEDLSFESFGVTLLIDRKSLP